MNSIFYAGIVYMIIIAALCSKTVWIINAGRIAAGFCTAAAARKFGVRGGGAVGVLSASAFLLAEQSLGRCGAMLAFAGLASDYITSGQICGEHLLLSARHSA